MSANDVTRARQSGVTAAINHSNNFHVFLLLKVNQSKFKSSKKNEKVYVK